MDVQKINVNGRTIEYFSFGHGKKTMVILPGLSIQSVMLSKDAVAEAYNILSDEFTVYLFERPVTLPPVYTVYDSARDTAEAFRLLGLQDICLFGVSMGGMIAQVIACRYPEMIHKMIIGSTTARISEERSEALSEWVSAARAHDPLRLCLGFGEAVYPPEMFKMYTDYLKTMAAGITDAELDRFSVQAEGTRGFDITPELDKISCPVYLIEAADDAVLGPDAHLSITSKLGKRSDFCFYMYEEGYGHAAYDTAPDYKQRILDFFTAE
ncbi:MAG: alpha/beta hydrolase [Solobacterium sp.]|nr:alpha/beta hydrolase [Solobacterium sp.]